MVITMRSYGKTAYLWMIIDKMILWPIQRLIIVVISRDVLCILISTIDPLKKNFLSLLD